MHRSSDSARKQIIKSIVEISILIGVLTLFSIIVINIVSAFTSDSTEDMPAEQYE